MPTVTDPVTDPTTGPVADGARFDSDPHSPKTGIRAWCADEYRPHKDNTVPAHVTHADKQTPRQTSFRSSYEPPGLTKQESTGPSGITGVQVTNYRTLRSAEVDGLQSVTVAIGPNGSGKSAFVDLFAFLHDCFTEGIRAACERRGGVRNIRSRGMSGPIGVAITYRETPATLPITYRLELDEERGRPYIARETLTWTTGPARGLPRPIFDFQRGNGRIWDEHTGQTSEQALADDTVLAAVALGQISTYPRAETLRSFVSGWYVPDLNSDAARSVPPAGPHERLSRTGSNLANVLQLLQEQQPDRLDKIRAVLRTAIPTFGDVDVVSTPDNRLVLRVRDTSFDAPFLANDASDGTATMLAYLVLLTDPAPAPFIAMEAPENFIYPTLLPDLASICRTAAERSQVLLTTHAPDFLNAFRPDEVIAFHRGTDGYTRTFRPAELSNVTAMLDSGAGLGQLWREGYFEPLPQPRCHPPSGASHEGSPT